MKMFLSVLWSLFACHLCFSATLTVTSTEDSVPGSLRQAIADAAAGDIITFALPSPSTISLTSGNLLVNKDLTISGPGARSLTIERNSSAGVFGIIEIASGQVVTISGVTLTHANGDFGAIDNLGTLILQSCAVSDNTAFDLSACAGGICNEGNLTVLNSTIANNVTEDAAAGISSSKGTVTLTNCTISGNDVGGSALARQIIPDPPQNPGGGLFVSGGSALITNCTITNNFASFGGDGIYVGDASVQIKNTLIAGNGTEDVAGKVDSLGYNLIGNADAATISPTTGDQIGTALAPIDPMLGPLQDNGGATKTHALLNGSPAVDKGAAADGVATDQRGLFRPVDAPSLPPADGGDNSDIGAFEKQAAHSLNISTRADVLTGEKILDGGFIITGTGAKQVLIRGLGPSLGEQMLSGFLADPVLELHDSAGALLVTNDNWKETQAAEINATGIPPTDDAESAIVTTLDPGAYTAILSGHSGGTGVGLVEVYDLDTAAISTLGNTSTRGFVGTNDNVMISGFILGAGEGAMDRVIVRALGPSLQIAGIVDRLADPALELHNANGALIASDDDWQDTQKSEIEATDLAPPNPKESAIVQTLAAGNYTAIVRGVDQTTGVGLLEVYDLH
ncbi:MAG: right-handed parallel beta-helix repeat-containing protein [Chthoniobacterales bacterium]|nr:right-handed parallel beta-helix repeat-containing protein [Chthoniobacterales bacterium]